MATTFRNLLPPATVTRYEITIELPNGDWKWDRLTVPDYHALCICALDLAKKFGGRVHHVEKLAQ